MFTHVVMGRRPDNKIILSCLVLSPSLSSLCVRVFCKLATDERNLVYDYCVVVSGVRPVGLSALCTRLGFVIRLHYSTPSLTPARTPRLHTAKRHALHCRYV